MNYDYPPFDPARAVFSEEVLAEVAELRARGKSWEDTAKAVQWDVEELCKAARRDPNYHPALERARREVEDEANDEGLAHLRELTRCGKPRTALEAHKVITRYLAEKDRNRTRLEVERMRHEERMARAGRQSAKADLVSQKQAEEEARQQAEDEEIDRRFEEARVVTERSTAEHLAREEAIVYLWGGCHKIGGTPPDETDTPLYLTGDHTVSGRMLYWVLARPTVTDPFNGPFLKPPGCRPAPCPPPEAA